MIVLHVFQPTNSMGQHKNR